MILIDINIPKYPTNERHELITITNWIFGGSSARYFLNNRRDIITSKYVRFPACDKIATLTSLWQRLEDKLQ